jgi:hypothetical protein
MSCKKHGYTNGVYCPVCDKQLADAYNFGREAGLKEAAAICDNSPWHFSKYGLCASLANTIRARIATSENGKQAE